jgi:hypothetical protein
MSMALQIEDGDVQSLREALHEAHFTKQSAEAKLAACQRALANGEQHVATVQAELQRHDADEKQAAEVEAHRLADIAAGRPVSDSHDDGAEERALARQVHEAKLADATRARSILQSEVEAARRDLAAAAGNVDAAISGLLVEAGDRLAAELTAAENLALDLRLRLAALEGLSHSAVRGRPDHFRMGAHAARVLNRLPLNDSAAPARGPAHVSPLAPYAREWGMIMDALRDDPDAPLPGLEDQ